MKSKAAMVNTPEIARAYVKTLTDHAFVAPAGFAPEALTLTQAYDVQDAALRFRQLEGDQTTGYKVGCTSAAIRTQFGLTEPVSARLFRSEQHASGSTLSWDNYVNLAVEPEFALFIGQQGQIEWIAAAIEIHNYRFWSGTPSSQELVMSNAIHAGVVLGETRMPVDAFDMNAARVDILINDEIRATGFGHGIMQGPLSSLAWLERHLHKRNLALQPGHIVIPGSPVELISVPRGARVETRIEGLGNATALFA